MLHPPSGFDGGLMSHCDARANTPLPHDLSPTSYCWTSSASPIFTVPSQLTSPHSSQGGVHGAGVGATVGVSVAVVVGVAVSVGVGVGVLVGVGVRVGVTVRVGEGVGVDPMMSVTSTSQP